MRKTPKQQRSRAVVDVILEAAVHVLAAQGYAKATTRRIADRAGVSVGSLYQFFESKEQIYAAALEQELLRMQPPIKPSMPPPPGFVPDREILVKSLEAMILATMAELTVTRALLRQAPHLIEQSGLFAQKPLIKMMLKRQFFEFFPTPTIGDREAEFEVIYAIFDVLFRSGWPPDDSGVSEGRKASALAGMIANCMCGYPAYP